MPVSVHAVAAELRARHPGLGALKLHKLLYYCQGHHLATFGEPLFSQTISAWDNGPVVGELWFSENRGLPAPEGESESLGEAGLNTVGYVMSRYGALSGRDLVNLTHSEEPWRRADAEREPRTSRPIARSWMRDYFRADVGEDEDIVLDALEVKEWLHDAGRRRDTAGRPDDPEEIAAALAELRDRVAR